MKITILTDNSKSWVIPYIEDLKKQLYKHNITHVFSSKDISGGDVMLILSCEKILPLQYLKLHKNNIVVHPSKVPHGKGWSPLAWQVLEGSNDIPISLFEAVEQVDAGDVYLVDNIHLEGHELNEEIKKQQGLVLIRMVKRYIDEYDTMVGIPQSGEETFYPRRKQKENQLDITKSIADQFNLFRVVDNERYPAHFQINGQKYILKIYKEME